MTVSITGRNGLSPGRVGWPRRGYRPRAEDAPVPISFKSKAARL
jgi:hypothetical protein